MPTPLYWPIISSNEYAADGPEPDLTFPVSFRFASLYSAYTCMLYWATSLLLWLTLSHMYHTLDTIPPGKVLPGNSTPGCCSEHRKHYYSSNSSLCNQTMPFDSYTLPPISPSLDIMALSRYICQSVPYFQQDCMQGLGPALVAIPLVAVIETLKDVPECEREVSWAKGAMQRVKASGMRLMGV